ncbi:uncharacterized protein [Primulina huaijiensis]|uniref:uncharacterized protein isoform X1 n=1 Tax=Primulina huaijiensis TaxID=1492673 RepID=UPI003CC77997
MGDQGDGNNVLQKIEKRIEKKLKKGKTGKESVTGLHGVENVGRNEVSEHEHRSQTEDITEMSRNPRKNKEKKANKEVKDAEAVDMEKDASHGQLIGVYGEDGSEDARNQEKRKKKKSKTEACYFPRYEVRKLEGNEVLEKPVEEKVSKHKSGKSAKKEGKKQISMEIHNVGDRDREYEDREQGGTFDDNIEGSVTEKVKAKKRKRGRTDGKDDYFIESQGNCAGAMKSKIYDGLEENMTVENGSKSKKMYELITEDLNDDFSNMVKRKKKKAVEDEHNEGGDVEKHKRRKKKNKTYGNEVEGANIGNCAGAMESKIYDGSKENMTMENESKSKKMYESITEDLNDDFSKMVKRKKKKAVEDEHNEGGDVEKHKRRKKKNKSYGNEVEEANKGNCDGATESKIYDGSEENMTMENETKSKKMYESITEDLNDDFSKMVKRKKKKAAEDEHNEGEDVKKHKRRKKKDKTYGNEVEEANKGKNKKAKLVGNNLDDPTPSKSNKKVSFSGQVEVFPLSDDSNTKEIYDEENLLRGKRFTPEENEIVKAAVYRFIEDRDLGKDGLDMVLNCRKHPELRGCWKEIGAAIPYRPYSAVYYRAQLLFRRSASRKWTQEEYDMILKYQELNGNEWKALADELGKHRWHVKDTWRRIKLQNMNKGQWTQKEYQNLFDLVNIDLQQKLSEEKRSKHGMLRDNISWTAISDKLSTRAQANCCIKWYNQLTSPMVAEGLWADSDDYRMLKKLYLMDAGCMEDVDWDTLLDHRSGDLCQKRWNQMVMHIGNYGTKPFLERVDVLAQRYCPELVEAREIWDNKPRVP